MTGPLRLRHQETEVADRTMNTYLTILSAIFTVLGILFLFFPRTLIRINQFFNRVLIRDTVLLRYQRVLGLVLCVTGVVMLLEMWLLL